MPREEGHQDGQKTPTKSTMEVRKVAETLMASGSKLRPRHSLRTPQQEVPLKLDDRLKNRRASRSFVLADQDLETPRSNIEAFMNMTETGYKVKPLVGRFMSSHSKTPTILSSHETGSVFKAPRVKELAAEGIGRPRVSSPGSRYTPRTNIWNLLATGSEKSMIERTEDLSEPISQDLQPLTSVGHSGQRVSVSPIHDPSTSTYTKDSKLQIRVPGKTTHRSFHLNIAQHSVEGGRETSVPLESMSIKHSGQRVSVSPITVSDKRADSEVSHIYNKAVRKASRRSFHVDVPQSDDDSEAGMERQADGHTGNQESEEVISTSSQMSENELDGINPGNQSDSGEMSYQQDRQRAREVTGTHLLNVEHTDLVIGGGTEVIQNRTSLGPVTAEISPTEQILSSTRKASVSKLMVSIGKELSMSPIPPPDFDDESEEELPGGKEGVIGWDAIRNEEDKSNREASRKEDEKSRQQESNNIQEINESTNKFSQRKGEDGMERIALANFDVTDPKPRQASYAPEAEEALEEPNGTAVAVQMVGNEAERTVVAPIDQDTNTQTSKTTEVDPASVYDLSEGSSSSRLETSKSKSTQNKSDGSSSAKKRPVSQKKITPTSSVKKRGSGQATLTPASAGPTSSKRKRLNFSEWKSAQAAGGSTEAFTSPLPGRTLRDSPRSSTPVDRTRRFFNSTKVQRSVTEYFQGDDELEAAAMTPTVKNLFSDISPIRPPGTSHKAQERGSGVEVDEDPGGNRDSQQEDERGELMRPPQKASQASHTNSQGPETSQSSDSEMPSFSAQATPHFDMRKRVSLSSTHRKGKLEDKSKAGTSKQALQKPTQEKKAPTKRPRKELTTTLPRRSVKYFAELHSDMKLSKDAIEEIEGVSEQFWANTFKALEAYALHAGRKTIQDQDVILLMKTQRLITGTDDLHNKIRQMLPMELRKELIPCAYPVKKK